MGQVSGIIDVGAPIWGHVGKSVAGGVDVTLTQSEYENRVLRFTGTLTGNISVIVPLTDGFEWLVVNGTAGAFTLTVKGSTGTGVLVTQGSSCYVRADGTNIARCTPEVPTTLVTLTQTYATADATHANLTSADLTGISSSTTGSALAEPGAAYTQSEMQQNFRRIQDQYNALKADVTDLKQFVNSLVDALQAQRLVG